MKKLIEYPCMNGFCEKCKFCYMLDGDEYRCLKISIGLSNAMCVQVKECNGYRPKGDV